MQIKERCILRHSNGLYLNRRLDGFVQEEDAAMRFKDAAEASEWLLNGYYAPEDTENYSYVTIEIITRVKGEVESERNQESVSEDQPSHAGR